MYYEFEPGQMFQTDGGAEAGNGDPVGKALDLSGNDQHLTQSAPTRRMTVGVDGDGAYYVVGDGSQDYLRTAAYSIDSTEMTLAFLIVMATTPESIAVGQGPAYDSAGSFYVANTGGVLALEAGGTGYRIESVTGYDLGLKQVAIAHYDRTTPDITVDVDLSEDVTTSVATAGAIVDGFGTDYPFSVGARDVTANPSLPSTAKIYAVLQIDRALTTAEKTQLVNYWNTLKKNMS